MPDPTLVTPEMRQAVTIYARDVVLTAEKMGVKPGPDFILEALLHAPSIHADNFGSMDCVLYARAVNHLFLWDYKHGHRKVEAFENWQLINYVAAALDHYQINGFLDQKTVVHIRIVQPRAYHIDGPIQEWIFNASEIRAYVNILAASALEALTPGAPVTTGVHCRDCSARYACDTALKEGIGLYELVTRQTPIEMGPEALSVQYQIILRAQEAIKALETGFEARIKELIKKGLPVPGFALVPAKGRVDWTCPVDEVEGLGAMYGVATTKKEPITPAQAIAAGVDESMVKALSGAPDRGLKLEQVNLIQFRKVFG
jgi:hypothetical protein